MHVGPVWKTASFILYYLIARPLVCLFLKIVFHQRTVMSADAKKAGLSGAYIYANHTNALLDAFAPNILRGFGRSYIIAGPDVMSIPGLNNIVEMLGVIPLGSTLRQKKEMLGCVRARIGAGASVAIYPEAHIWPYYTGIRPFTPDAFVYPASDGAPVFAMTNCYQRRAVGGFPSVTTYLDGPFYADMALPRVRRREELRTRCHDAMTLRAGEHSTYEYVRYVKRPVQTE